MNKNVEKNLTNICRKIEIRRCSTDDINKKLDSIQKVVTEIAHEVLSDPIRKPKIIKKNAVEEEKIQKKSKIRAKKEIELAIL